MVKTLGIVKRIDLTGLAEGWDGCHLLARGVTVGELKQIQQLETDGLDEEAGINMMMDFVKNHIVGGSVKTLNDNGELEDSKMEKEYVDQMSVDMIVHAFAEMTGVGAQYSDPKGSSPAAKSNEPQQSSSTTTETQSSKD